MSGKPPNPFVLDRGGVGGGGAPDAHASTHYSGGSDPIAGALNPTNITVSAAAGQALMLEIGGNEKVQFTGSEVRLASDEHVKFYSDPDIASGSADAGLNRAAAGRLKVTNGGAGAGALDVGNLRLATNTLSSENANGNIVLDPNGSGEVQLSSANLSAFGNLQNASLSFWLRSGDARFGSGQHLVFCSGDINSAADVGLKRDSAGVWLDTDASTGLGKRLTGRVVEANTAGSGAPNVLASTESRKLLTNEGATAENYHTLPSAAAGIELVFYCQDTDGIRVVAGAGDTIRRGATVSAAAGFVKSTTVGSALILVAINATEWVAISEIGTWTTDA